MNDKVKKVIIIVCSPVAVLVFMISAIFFSRDNFSTKWEINFKIKRDIGLKNFEFVDYRKEKEGRYEEHYWTYREKNERGIEFIIKEYKYYSVNFGFYRIETENNYDYEVLKNYIEKNELPEGASLYNETNDYIFIRNGSIDIVFSNNDDLESKVENIYEYLKGFYIYNYEITGIKRDLKVMVTFNKENSKDYYRIILGDEQHADTLEDINYEHVSSHFNN